MADTSTSTWTPVDATPGGKYKFSWTGDPATKFRGRGRARITPGDSRAMQDYNERLYAPSDTQRGGGLVSYTPTAGAPRAQEAWQMPEGRSGLARIQAAHGGGPIGSIHGPNAGIEGEETASAGIENPHLAPSPIAPNPLLEANVAAGGTGTAPMEGNYTDSRHPNEVYNPDGSYNMGESIFKLTGQHLGDDGPVVNPHTGAPVQPTPEDQAAQDQRDWIAQGGSLHTFHQAKVARGMRPQIDARSTSAPANAGSASSNAIQAGWGWTPRANAVASRATTAQTNFNNSLAN